METTDHVIIVRFAESSKAYQGLSELRQASAQGRIDLRQAAIVERNADGSLRIPDGADMTTGLATTGGGFIGMLVGILGGPLGMLLGWGTGAIIGGIVDSRRVDLGQSGIAQMSRWIEPGATVLVASVREPAVEVVDSMMTVLDGHVLRLDSEAVINELESADEAAKAAEREADRVMREQRKETKKEEREEKAEAHRAKWDERIDALKDRFEIGK